MARSTEKPFFQHSLGGGGKFLAPGNQIGSILVLAVNNQKKGDLFECFHILLRYSFIDNKTPSLMQMQCPANYIMPIGANESINEPTHLEMGMPKPQSPRTCKSCQSLCDSLRNLPPDVPNSTLLHTSMVMKVP